MTSNPNYLIIDKSCSKFEHNLKTISTLIIDFQKSKAESRNFNPSISEYDLMQIIVHIIAIKENIELLEDKILKSNLIE